MAKRVKRALSLAHYTKYLPIAVIVLALLVRFWNFPAWFGFDYDQEINAWIAKTILVDHKPVLIGPETSVGGMYVGPYFNYVIALFFLIGRMNPTTTILLNILVSGATIAAFYLIGSRIFNRLTGLTAAILYGFSSFIINYDRVLWNPTPVPLVSLLTIYFLYRFLQNSSFKYLALTIAGIGLLLQLHFQAVFLGAFVFLTLLIFRPKTFLNIKADIYMLIPLVIFLAPLVFFDLRHGFLNSRHFLQFFLTGSSTESVDIAGNLARMLNVTLSLFENVSAVMKPFLAATVGIILVLTSVVHSGKNLFFRLSLGLLIFSLTLIALYRGPLPIQYFLFLIPVFILLPADILQSLWTKKTPLRWLSPLTLLLFIVINLSALIQSKNEINLWAKQQAVKYVVSALGSNKNVQIDIVAQPGLNTGYKYLFWQAGLNPYYGADRKDLRTFKIIVPLSMARPDEITVNFGPVGVQSL